MTINNPVVETTYGPVRGIDDGRVRVWKGIRYAAAPVGDLRFRAPEPPERWTEVADATEFGAGLPATGSSTLPDRPGRTTGRGLPEPDRVGIVGHRTG